MPSSRRPKSSQTLRTTTRNAHPRRNTRSSGPLRVPLTQSPPSPEAKEDAISSPALLSKRYGKSSRSSAPAFHNRSESRLHPSNAHDRRTSVAPSFMMSTTSAMPPQVAAYAEDKQSGFRATIRRMFGSRAHRQPVMHASSEINYSDPGNLMANNNTSAEMVDAHGDSRLHRPPSRPVTHSSALGSHAPTTSPRGLIDDTVPAHRTQKRRNTLPSPVLSDTEAENLIYSIKSNANKADLEHATAAYASPDNRRSRSVEAFSKNLDLPYGNGYRLDREAELTYWRQSFLVEQAPSTQYPLASPDEVGSPPGSPESQRQPHATIKPSQSFDFGLSIGAESVALEERVNTLEVKMFDFEYAIARLQGAEVSRPILQPAMSRSKSSRDLLTRSSHHSVSSESSARRMTSFSRPRPPNVLMTEPIEAECHDSASCSDTPRPKTSQGVSERPLSGSSVRITRRDYEALLTIINDEKEARQQMEMRIMNLQHEVQQLQAPVFAAINYTTPGQDKSLNTQRIKTLHRTHNFDFDHAARNQSRFSVDSDAEIQSDDFVNTYHIPQERLGFGSIKSPSMIGVSVI